MPDPIEEFRAWYDGPDGKRRWISEAESVEGFLARAFQAGWVRHSQQPPEVPLPVRMQISPGGLREAEGEAFEVHRPRPFYQHGPRPAGSGMTHAEKSEAFRMMYTPRPVPVTRITDYVMTNRETADDTTFEAAQDPFTRLQPGQEGEYAPEQTMAWPRIAPDHEVQPPFSFGKSGTAGMPPSADPDRPQEDEDAAS